MLEFILTFAVSLFLFWLVITTGHCVAKRFVGHKYTVEYMALDLMRWAIHGHPVIGRDPETLHQLAMRLHRGKLSENEYREFVSRLSHLDRAFRHIERKEVPCA